MKKSLMFQSTLSGSGKSLITATVCRHLSNKGYNVSPFKSLNISLNSYITGDGKEIGISQAFQSWACGKEPCHQMNPILLKATGNKAAQMIVNGVPTKEFNNRDEDDRNRLMSIIHESYESLEKRSDVIVIEGSGTPAEINLKDIANMATAEMIGTPVIMIGDIDTGGVFAGLFGTYKLLEKRHRKLIKGFLINKFRGDPSILSPGIQRIEKELCSPCLGVISHKNYSFPQEDSLSMGKPTNTKSHDGDIRKVWLKNLDSFMIGMQREVDFELLEKIIAEGI